LLGSAKLIVGRKYKLKADLDDAPSRFERGEILTFVRTSKAAAYDRVICVFRAPDNSMKYLDLYEAGCRDWRDVLSPVDWLS